MWSLPVIRTGVEINQASPYDYCGIIYNNQNMEATYVSINRRMDKENVV